MNPATYVDYTVKVGSRASMEEVSQGASCLMKALHAGFSEFKGKFALALPFIDASSPQKKISTFRVFAETMNDHVQLHEFVSRSTHFEKSFTAGFPKVVSPDFSGPYKAFSRIRIKSRADGEKRLKKMLEVEADGSPWLNIQSSENGHRFRMYLQSHVSDALTVGVLSGYGLSQAESLHFLPDI